MDYDLSQCVDRYYQMDPETEDLLYAVDLKNGMSVLVASPDSRGELSENLRSYPGGLDTLIKMNRWATVTFLKTSDDFVHFIALYDDGTKRVQQSSKYSGWLVKKDTVPPKDLEVEWIDTETATAYNKHDVAMTTNFFGSMSSDGVFTPAPRDENNRIIGNPDAVMLDGEVYLDLDFGKIEQERRAAEDLQVKLLTYKAGMRGYVYPFGSGTKYQAEYLENGRIKYVNSVSPAGMFEGHSVDRNRIGVTPLPTLEFYSRDDDLMNPNAERNTDGDPDHIGR